MHPTADTLLLIYFQPLGAAGDARVRWLLLMYIKVTKSLLGNRPKGHLLKMFGIKPEASRHSKSEIISSILSRYLTHKKWGATNLYLAVCEYCRKTYFVGVPAKAGGYPVYCVSCGRTSPNRTFQRNVERTALLISLASKMKKKEESGSRNILLEQAVVTVITSLEVLMRDVYSLILDHEHVIYGESIYPRIYASTRNEFLGLGSANTKLKRDISLNLKEKLGQANYSYLSKMFSARHIIVHNCSIKDKDYVSQTGDDPKNVNQKLSLTMQDVKKLMSISKRLGILADNKLRECVLKYYRKRTDLIIELSSSAAI
jgi:hypothetical protein